MMSGKNVIAGMTSYRTEDLIRLKSSLRPGKIKSVIDRRYPLEQIAEAHRYVDSGQKIGNVVISVGMMIEPGSKEPSELFSLERTIA